jgi:hypothetical protein
LPKQFEVVFHASGAVVVADLLEEAAPITCEDFWGSIAEPVEEVLHQGRECGPELWCYVPAPAKEPPYENSTVLPEHGDVLYYHFLQPASRDARMVYDIGIYWDRGQSKIAQGWIAGNLFARVNGAEQIETLRKEAGRMLLEGEARVTVRRCEEARRR